MKLAFLAAASLLCASTPQISGLKKLNVVAIDSHGQPVTDLLASDLQVSEDGKTKEIAYFRFTGGKYPSRALSPEEYSNRAAHRSYPTAILIDFLSDRFLSDSVIGKQVTGALKGLESAEDVYLYLLTNRGAILPIHAQHGEDDETAPGAAPSAQGVDRMMDMAVKALAGLRTFDDFDPSIRLQLTLTAMKALTNQMEQIRGRKNLIWVTHGVPLNYGPVRLKRIAEQMEHAEIAVYTVQQSMQGAGQEVGTRSSETLEMFNHVTGGRGYGSDSVKIALSQARTDSRANYQIAYFTDAPDTGGARLKIRVACKRKDVHLEAEQDYYALVRKISSAAFEKTAVENAEKSPVEATEIGVSAKASPVSVPQDIRFDLQIDAADLLLRREQDRYTGKVSVVFATYAGDQFIAATSPVPVNINLTAQQYQAADGVAFQQTVHVDAKTQKVRAIVIDSDRRAVGSVTIPIPH